LYPERNRSTTSVTIDLVATLIILRWSLTYKTKKGEPLVEDFQMITLSVTLGLVILILLLAVFHYIIVKKLLDCIYDLESRILARTLVLTKQLNEFLHPPIPQIDPNEYTVNEKALLEMLEKETKS
jgi:hypothetical protein